jgi:hypothetical protein
MLAIEKRDELLIARDVGSIICEIQGSGDIGLQLTVAIVVH